MIPRLGVFESVGGGGKKGRHVPVYHMVLVDGDELRLTCIRQAPKYGKLVAADSSLTCNSCKVKGWAQTLGNLRYEGDRVSAIKAQDKANSWRVAS